MSTLNQIFRNPRKKKKKLSLTSFMNKCPHKKGICVRVTTTKPKKPHSAIRKIAKILMPREKKHVLVSIPGQGHNLSVHSVVLIRGGRVRDIPGIQAKIIRNKYDLNSPEPFIRKRRRSKYSLPKLK